MPSLGTMRSRHRGFIPPNENEVRNYCESIGYDLDPMAFIDFYQARGWMVSQSVPLLDWKAMIRTWQRNGSRKQLAKVGAPLEQFASLGSLQLQLKRVEEEMTSIMYPGGSAWKVIPEGQDLIRFHNLQAQRNSLKERMSKF